MEMTIADGLDPSSGLTRPQVSGVPRSGSWTQSERVLLSSSVEYPFGVILSKRLGHRRNETAKNRKRRLRIILGLRLHDSVENRLVNFQSSELNRVTNFVESLKDNVLLSTPEAGLKPQFKILLKWAYSIGAYRTDSGVKQWKLFSALIKWKGLQSETPEPERPTDLPGFGLHTGGELPHFWCILCPWLKTIWTEGASTKHCLTRIAHITSTRGFPPGDATTRARSLAKHRETIERSPDINPVRTELLRRLSYLIGKKLKEESDYSSQAHLSLTSSSSYDTTVREGGRSKEIEISFRTWAEKIPQRTVEGTTLLGKPYTHLCGFPVWITQCRDSPETFIRDLPHDCEGALSKEVILGESRQDTAFDFQSFVYEDPIYGLDNATGYQLHQWSVETLLSLGILEGEAHDASSIRFSGATLPLIRRSCIGEPGAKSRVVTIGEAALTVFLQPYSHHVTGWLRTHPSALTGLTRAAQGFEYVKAMHSKDCPSEYIPDVRMLSSDLETATDYCVHVYSQAMLDGFTDGLGETSQYHQVSSRLLCSGRRCLEAMSIWTTRRGILMGDPGAKAVLTLHNLCAELESFLRFRRNPGMTDEELLGYTSKMLVIPGAYWRHFACSGDDHLAIGPERYLRGITRAHSENGLAVSWPQNFVSKIGAVYCEEFLFIRNYSLPQLFRNEWFWKMDYETHVHVDSVKLRLLSPCSKEHEGKDEPNPGIGKSFQLSKVLNWLPTTMAPIRCWVSRRFSERFSAFLPTDIRRYVPVSLGGLSTPAFHLDYQDVMDQLQELSMEHQTLAGMILLGSATPVQRRVVSGFSGNARARGIHQDLIEDQIKELLSSFEAVGAIDVNELPCVIKVDPDEFKDWNIRKKLREASSHGFISVNDAVNLISRPYIFRDLLFPDMSERHGIVPQLSGAYEPLPWSVRIRRFEESSTDVVQGTELKALTFKDCSRISRAVTEGATLEVPSSNRLVPRSVVQIESRPTLQTPYHGAGH